MSYKFEIGQEVKVRGDLKAGRRYGAMNISCHQAKYAGKTVKILSRNDGKYTVDSNGTILTESMLSPVSKAETEKKKIPSVQEGKMYRISPTLKYGFNHIFFVNEKMGKLAGRIAKITSVSGNIIRIDIDNGEWAWSTSMFSEEVHYKIGDRVLIRKGIKEGESPNGVYIVPEMVLKAGTIVTLKSHNKKGFRINEDTWNWPESVFDRIVTPEDEKQFAGSNKISNESEPKKEIGSKYKVGDRVVVRSDLVTGKCGADSVVGNMLRQAGKTVTIAAINVENPTVYSIKEDSWNWTNEMFEGLAKPESEKTYFIVNVQFETGAVYKYQVKKDARIRIGDKVFVDGAKAGEVGTCISKPEELTESELDKMIHGITNLKSIVARAELTVSYVKKPL